MKPIDITGDFMRRLKPGMKLLTWFDGDNGNLILYDKTWWLETRQYSDHLSNALYKQLADLMLRYYGAKWLYDER